MPIYDYKCKQCNHRFSVFASINSSNPECTKCNHITNKVLAPFAPKTENNLDAFAQKLEKQGEKDIVRYFKDDNFAANISGADDPNHKNKVDQVRKADHAKNEKARKKIKRSKT